MLKKLEPGETRNLAAWVNRLYNVAPDEFDEATHLPIAQQIVDITDKVLEPGLSGFYGTWTRGFTAQHIGSVTTSQQDVGMDHLRLGRYVLTLIGFSNRRMLNIDAQIGTREDTLNLRIAYRTDHQEDGKTRVIGVGHNRPTNINLQLGRFKLNLDLTEMFDKYCWTGEMGLVDRTIYTLLL